MQVHECDFLGFKVKFIHREECKWYFLDELIIYRPSVFIKREKIEENEYIMISSTTTGKRYVFSQKILILAISYNRQLSLQLIEHSILSILQNTSKIRSHGRKRKKFSDLQSDSRKRERRREIEQEFNELYDLNINEFIISPLNFPSISLCKHSSSLFEYLSNRLKNSVILQKISNEEVVLAKDKSILSYNKVSLLKQYLQLKSYIPSTSTLVRNTKILNEKIKNYYSLIIKPEIILIGNVKRFINDYCAVMIRKYPKNEIFYMKWSSDERKMRNDVGNIGLSIQILENENNQDPNSQIYLAIGDGKENLEFFEKNLQVLKEFCSLEMINNRYKYSDQVTIESFFLADLKHIWENSYYVQTELSLTPNSPHYQLSTTSNLSQKELLLLERSEREEGMFDHDDFEESDSDVSTESEEEEIKIDDPSHKCPMCGKTLDEIRELTYKETIEFHFTPPLKTLKHWLGIDVKYFCVLHCVQRCTERIIYHFAHNNQSQANKIQKIFTAQKLVRKSWKFSIKSCGKLYPQMLFGGEIKKILENIDNWFPCFPWLKEEDKEILIGWKKIHKLLHVKSQKIREYIENENFIKLREKINNFIGKIISRFGRDILQFYFHYIDYHFLAIIANGISLSSVQNQGVEHSHSLHKNIQRSMSSNDSGVHKTPSSHQILLRQLRIFVLENNINVEQNSNVDILIDTFIDDDIFDTML